MGNTNQFDSSELLTIRNALITEIREAEKVGIWDPKHPREILEKINQILCGK